MAEKVDSASNSPAHFPTEVLDLDIEDLNDAEYHIPPVENPPTLESILNDPDDGGSLSEDELHPQTIFTQEEAETVSLTSKGSSDTRSRSSSEKRHRKPNVANKPRTSILRHVILKGVSTQLTSAADRVNAGLPTCMAVSLYIAVGTSHGVVLVFDPNQALRWCLGSTSTGEQCGAVSSLGFNTDCTRLLVGFARGHIMMYDLTNGKLLRMITDAHPPGTAVLHVKFTDQPTLALLSDSGGSVFELMFTRTMGVRSATSRCIFSGSRGGHPLQDHVIVALATLSKVIIVTIRPQMRVLFTFPLQSLSGILPLLAWQFVIIQLPDDQRVIDPVIAFGRESTMYFYQLTLNKKSRIQLIPLQKLSVSYLLISAHWLNTHTLAFLDSLEQVHLVDVRTQEELETIDLSDVKLVYGSAFFKGLATGGNVSKALALAGEKACYHSIVSFGSQALLLGMRSFHVLTIRTWEERLDHLVKQGLYGEALALGQDFLDEKGKAVVGLKGSKERRRKNITRKMTAILVNFIEDFQKLLRNDDIDTDHCESLVSICVNYCINLNRIDLLYGQSYETFCVDPRTQYAYLHALEPFILNDQLTDIPPSIVQGLVTHYEQAGQLQALEACLVHLDVGSLDFHQVMTLCWSHGLYDALFSIYNRGLKNYSTPLEELMTVLQEALSTGISLTDQQVMLGNKILVYVSCCLAGRAYPIGDIPPEDVHKVKYEVFKCLTSIHSKNANDTESAYPYLRTLLHFNTCEFLNVFALAFEEAEFTSELGKAQRQRLVDILIQIMVHGTEYSPSQVGALFTFLARQISQPDSCIHVNRQLFDQVLEFITSPPEGQVGGERHEEREQALLELLRAGGLQHYDENHLLDLAEKAKFYCVCELLYEKRKEYNKILSCYLNDPLRQVQAFSYLRNLLHGPQFTEEERRKTEVEVENNIQTLIDIDNRKTGRLLAIDLPHLVPKVIDKFSDDSKYLYNFLQGIFETQETGSPGNNRTGSHLDPCVHEKYIELMCEFNPVHVHSHLKSSEGYRLEETMQITQHYNLVEATSLLLEKAGDIQGAFDCMKEKLETKVEEVTSSLVSGELSNSGLLWTQLNAQVLVLIQLCQRSSQQLDEKQRQKLWFPLLDILLKPQLELKSSISTESLQAFKDVTRHILNSMMGYLPLTQILHKVIQNPAYSSGTFGEVRPLVMGMLETYNYEATLLQTTTSLLNQDLHRWLSQLHCVANKGLVSRSNTCDGCKKNYELIDNTEKVILFGCNHSYHQGCLEESSVTRETLVCPSCSRKYPHSSIHAAPAVRRIRESTNNYKHNVDGEATEDQSSREATIEASCLSSQQLQSWKSLRKHEQSGSLLAVLDALSNTQQSTPQNRSVFKKDFELKLEAPRVLHEYSEF